MRIKNYFHVNGFALSLALEKKLGTTLNRPTLLPDWLLTVIWWNYRLTTQMRLVLRKNQRYSSFEFILICLPEQTLLGHSRNRPPEGNKCKNTPGRVSAKFTSLNNHQWPRLLCQRDVQTHYSSFPWTQMPWHSIVDKKKRQWVNKNYHSLNININILLTVLHTFLEIMLERICSTIKAFHLVWSIDLFSWPECWSGSITYWRKWMLVTIVA